MSQSELAALLGTTAAQICNYEAGKTRMAVSRLWKIGKIFNRRMAYFFDGLER